MIKKRPCQIKASKENIPENQTKTLWDEDLELKEFAVNLLYDAFPYYKKWPKDKYSAIENTMYNASLFLYQIIVDKMLEGQEVRGCSDVLVHMTYVDVRVGAMDSKQQLMLLVLLLLYHPRSNGFPLSKRFSSYDIINEYLKLYLAAEEYDSLNHAVLTYKDGLFFKLIKSMEIKTYPVLEKPKDEILQIYNVIEIYEESKRLKSLNFESNEQYVSNITKLEPYFTDKKFIEDFINGIKGQKDVVVIRVINDYLMPDRNGNTRLSTLLIKKDFWQTLKDLGYYKCGYGNFSLKVNIPKHKK